ncbi:MAG TPA: trypco2 family protein [Candidatus Sulfotelmatobacter sp.]
MSPKKEPTPVSLSELVKSVAAELRIVKADKPAAGEEVITLTNCDIELSVAATMEGSAGIKFYVVEIGGKGSATASHKITLKFSAPAGVIAAVQRKAQSNEEIPAPKPNVNK